MIRGFNERTVSESMPGRMRLKSDLGSCTADFKWVDGEARWFVSAVKYSRKGEMMRNLINDIEFINERGASAADYIEFYSKYGRGPENAAAIFEADMANHCRVRERARDEGIDPDRDVPPLRARALD